MSRLVLTRKSGQAILIGPDTRVEVRVLRGNLVEVVISAPRETKILREELALREEAQHDHS